MPFDALHIYFAASELNDILKGGRIDKVASPRENCIRLAVYSGKKTHGLLIDAASLRPHFRLTQKEREGSKAFPFVNSVKAHFLGGTIISITAEKNDRILYIEVKKVDELGFENTHTLVCEFFSVRSNLVLIDSNKKIVSVLKPVPLSESHNRAMLAGLTYTAPIKPEKKDLAEFDSVARNFADDNKANFILSNFAGISSKTAEELAMKNTAKDFLHEKASAPCIIKDNASGEILDFLCKPFDSLCGVFQSTTSLNEAMDLYYSSVSERDKLSSYSRRLYQAIKANIVKQRKKLAALLEREKDATSCEKNKQLADLLMSNLYKEKKGDTYLSCENYFSDGEVLQVKFFDGLGAKDTARKYYKKYQKDKKTLEMILPQLNEVRENLEYLEGLSKTVDNSETISDLSLIEEELNLSKFAPQKKQAQVKEKRAKTEKEKILATVKKTEFEGYTILTGKNNLQNDALIRGCAPNDIWLHLKDYHGAHTIIVNPKKTMPPASVLLFSAKQSVKLTKTALDENGLLVDYTFLKFVKKQKGALAGRVAYINHKTLKL